MSQQAERAELWRRAVSEQEGSGEPVRAFYRPTGLGEHSFYIWRQRFRRQQAPQDHRSAEPPVSWLEQFDAVNNLWRSKELFLTWDANKRRVYFNDGTWWLMDVESAPGEEDAGTLYPSLIQDSNGNQAKLNYRTGRSSWLANSSSRLQEVIDARNQSGTSYQSTYSFNWTSDEHLASVGPYTFLYSNTVNVVGPRGWNGGNYYGTTKMLTGVSRTDGGMHQFYYDYPEVGGTSAEMATIVLPYGAQLTYYWGGEGFFGGLSLRGVASRVLTVPLNLDGTQTQTTHTISRAQAPDSTAVHPTVTITGPKGKRVWNYAGGNRRATAYLEQDVAGTTLRRTDYVWSATPVTNVPYVSQTKATLLLPAPGFSTVSEQAVDQYGNVTSTIQKGDVGEPTPARTTTMTYLHNTSPMGGAYIESYIRNRMTKVQVTGVGGTFTPMEVQYDTASIVNDVPTFPPGILPPPPPSGLALHDSATYSLSYNLRGNATVITKGNATTVVQFIDKAGMVRKSNGPDGVVDMMPAAQWWQYGTVPGAMSLNGVQTGVTYDSMLRISSSTGPEGTGSYTWDSLDRPTSKTNPDGSSVRIEYSYAAGAKYTKEIVRNQWTKTWVDGLGRPVRAERGHGGVNLATSGTPRSTPETTVSLVDTRYGDCACTPFGKPIKVSRPRTSTSQPLVWTETVYDALGRTATVTGAPVSGTTGNSGTTTMNYETLDNGGYRQALVTAYDPAGRWKQSRTDVLGNLVQVVEPKPAGGFYLTDYVYNALGQMTTSTMTRDGYQGGVAQASVTQTRSWVYDSVGVLQSQTYPETGTTSFTYEQGKIKTKTDALNRKTEYVYDVTSRRLSEIRRFPAGSTTELTAQRTSYTYDAAGRPSIVASGGITETFGYSPVGQLASKTVQTPYGTLGMEWGYDSTGRVSQVKLPSGQIQRLIYDAAGRNPNVTDADPSVTDGAGTRSLYDPVTNATQTWWNDEYTATYDSFGRMSGMQVKPNYGSGATWSQSWSFNEGGQMSNYTLNKNTMTVSVNYAYTAGQESTGKLASMTSSATGLGTTTASYSYDALGRLSAATATGSQPWAQSYSFDGFGNLAGKTGTFGWTVGSGLNSAKNQTGNHDAAGNYTHNGGVYDHENRLTQLGLESYAYAADNRRVVRFKSAEENSFAEVTFWAGSTRVGVYKYTPAGSGWTLSAVVMQTGWIGGRQVKPQDRLGSDLSGGRMLLPFGEELVPTVNGVDKFATYLRDETGLDYADQRYHIPGGGRFASADPYQASAGAGDPGSWNRYAYVGGDPVNRVDPSGLLHCWLDGLRIMPHGSDNAQEQNVSCHTDVPGSPYFSKAYAVNYTAQNFDNGVDVLVRMQEEYGYLNGPGPLSTVRNGLRELSRMSFSRCRNVLEGATGQSINHFKQTLRNTAGFVYDGTTSTSLDNGTPVAVTLAAGSSNNAVSQVGGLLLWIKPSSWIGGLNQLDPMVGPNGALTALGYGTLIHEALHHYGVGHAQMRDRLGLPAGSSIDSTDINAALGDCLDPVTDPWRHL